MCLATHADHRSKGYAHMLMQYIIDEMLKEDMHIFKAETRKSNLKMQKIFDQFAYKLTSQVEDYFKSPVETAYKYTLEI